MARKRNSNRRYPPRICPQTGEEFIPSDRRQIYKNAQARIDANNDKRKIKRQPAEDLIKELKRNDEILAKLFLDQESNRYDAIGIYRLLVYENFTFEKMVEVAKVAESGNRIHWYFNYGLEKLESFDGYKIHRKKL